MSEDVDNPCLSCGACCATYRVSFYWAEADALGLDAGLTEALGPFLACMRGTSQARPRCTALSGRVGEAVHCGVYASRPAPCRSVLAGDDQCLRARARHGLPALPALPLPPPLN